MVLIHCLLNKQCLVNVFGCPDVAVELSFCEPALHAFMKDKTEAEQACMNDSTLMQKKGNRKRKVVLLYLKCHALAQVGQCMKKKKKMHIEVHCCSLLATSLSLQEQCCNVCSHFLAEDQAFCDKHLFFYSLRLA